MSTRALRIPLVGAAAVALLAGLLAAPAPAQAQEQPAPQNTPTVEQEELRTYAEAYIQIADVRARLQQQMAQASGQEEQAQIRQQANQEMRSILQEHGISTQRYREITNILNNDQEQRNAFTSMVEEIRAEQEDDPPLR